MPRRQPVYREFFDPPLTDDVEELLGRFQQLGSVRYGDFAAIWREMRFSDVFLGFRCLSEMKGFCRVILATAVKYFMPPYSYQIRVGGLYLMHALYHTQLASPPANIRLALKDWIHVQNFRRASVEAGHYDVAYILLKLEAGGAIHYTAMPHFLTFQKLINPQKEVVCAEFVGRTTAVQDILSLGIFEEMANVEGHYEQLKEATEGVRGQVALTHRDFTSSLKDTMSEFLTWQKKHFSSQGGKTHSRKGEEEEDEEEEASGSRRARLLSSIKQKSYSNFQEVSKSRRHMQVETVEPQAPDPQQVQEAEVRLKKKKPMSLRARTCTSLGVPPKGSISHP